MAIILNDSIRSNSPKSMDDKYGVFASGAFRAYLNIAEANSSINSSFRSVGLTVLVQSGGLNKEYWYKDGILDTDLVPKYNISVLTPLSLNTTTGVLSINQATSSVPGYLGAADWVTFNSKLTTVSTTGSIIGLGTSATPIQLQNDQINPGTNKVYGTDNTGVKGWKNDPSAGGTIAAIANLGSLGSSLFSGIAGTTANFRKIAAGPGILVSQTTNTVLIEAIGSSTAASVTTTDDTPTSFEVCSGLAASTTGLVEVTMTALGGPLFDKVLVGKKYVKYYKNSSGNISILGVSESLIPDTTQNISASWSLLVNTTSNNIDAEVVGEDGVTLSWQAETKKVINNSTTS